MTIPIFDGHNDTLTKHPDEFLSTSSGHVDLASMRAGAMRGGIFAVFVPSPGESATGREIRPGVRAVPFSARVPVSEAAAAAGAAAGRLLAFERDGHVVVARRIEDVDRACAEMDGPPVTVLHLEGAEPIDTGLEALELWYAAGLRSLGPVWSRPNDFAEGVPFIFGAGPDTGPGLTPAGVELVRRCAELGVMVDLAHLNEAGFWDVAGLELGPLVNSHTGATSVALTSRGLTDAQLDAVRDSGGLVGIVYAVYFLDPAFSDDPDVGFAPIVAHARYVADRIGVEHVGLGSDFDGTTVPLQLGSAANLQKLLDALLAAGFTRDEVEMIAWRNWRRVLDAWWH